MIKLNNELSLVIEKLDNRARLIIYKKNEELVCRKSSFSEFDKLFQADETHLFKGRLQLYRHGHHIAVEVKCKQEGRVGFDDFRKHLPTNTIKPRIT